MNPNGSLAMGDQLGFETPTKPQPGALMTSGSMLDMLRRHYVPDESRPAGVFAPEIQAPGPVGRRADLIWQGCTAAAGNALVGHEIKVTRADVLTELSDLTKSDPWQKYCDRWYLVVPHVSLIQGLDLPESWGVLLPPSGRRTRSMTVHRPAPELRPLEQGPALKTLVAWQCWKLRDQRNQVETLQRENKNLRNEQQELRIRAEPRTHSATRDLVERVVRELGGVQDWTVSDGPAPTVGPWNKQVPVEDVIAGLRDLAEVYRLRETAHRDLDRIQSGLVNYQRVITNALADVDKANQR